MQNPIRNLDDFNRYAVNRKDQMEVIRQSLYDFQTYAMAGQTQLTFFALPVGQGGKTRADTNMTTAGSLPAPLRFAVQTMEIYFTPGVFPSAAAAATAIDNHVNDIWEVYTAAAWLELQIGSKPYLIEGGVLHRMPPSTRLNGFAGMSDTTTAGATGFERTSHLNAGGIVYRLDPTLLLEPTQNFSVTINWPTAVAISAAGRIGVVMNGVTARNSQ
jgi:hypothetical protein